MGWHTGREPSSVNIRFAARVPVRRFTLKLQNVQASDNFKNLLEVPLLFYALVAVSLALNQTPSWLVAGAWVFVVLRVVHSFIHCTHNRVIHRFVAFGSSFLLLVLLWFAFIGGFIAKCAA